MGNGRRSRYDIAVVAAFFVPSASHTLDQLPASRRNGLPVTGSELYPLVS